MPRSRDLSPIDAHGWRSHPPGASCNRATLVNPEARAHIDDRGKCFVRQAIQQSARRVAIDTCEDDVAAAQNPQLVLPCEWSTMRLNGHGKSGGGDVPASYSRLARDVCVAHSRADDA